ncbi:hypothetical protein RRF57_005410 [Xylaria bambusicola]|uniref:Uncharacterized protein n=1 Tax=Xylaria bambusicola TaxID=326684 RepID=A0AAN7UCK6_9PEZI
MIAAAASTTPKQRKRTTIFGSTYYDEYTYDGLPGPGESFHTDPVLAFLHGLSWAVDPQTTCYRRSPMPTWSWVSVFGGSINFDCDQDGPKELRTDVWTILDSDVKVWLPLDKGLQWGWTPFGVEFQNSQKKVIPELSPFLKLESRVGDIGDVTLQPRDGESTYSFDQVSVSIAGLTKTKPYEIHIDCHEELPPHPHSEVYIWDSLRWKFILINRTSIYNPESKWRHAWEDWQPMNVFLVIRPFGQYWERVRILKTKDKLYQNSQRESIVLA